MSSSGRPPITTIIEGQLYLGDRHAAADLDLLRSFGVTHVVNAAKEQPNFHPADLLYYNCNLWDISTETIEFEGPLAFIQSALDQGGVVFVHCMQGKSRSASLVIAYVIRAYGMSLDDALAKVQELRSVVQPNRGFLRQLREFETRSIYGQEKSYSFPSNEYPYSAPESQWQAQAEVSMEEGDDRCTVS